MEDNQYVYENKEQEVKPSRPKNTKVLLIICITLLVGIVAGVTFKVADVVIRHARGIRTAQSQEILEEIEDEVQETQLMKTSNTVVSDVSQVVEDVMPSIVSITNMSVQQVQNFFGGTREQEMESSGSGIIIGENDTELLIVTNNHVIEESTTLTITFVDEESVEGIVKGTEVNKDLAIVAIPLESLEASTRDAIKIATLGDSEQLRVGEPAIAIGNALGYGQSVTTGVVSALGRDIEMRGFDNTLIQTDAAINPGNSGGALLNANGEVIGINTIKLNMAAVEGMGYAIPISDVSDNITKLMNRETRTKVDEEDRGYMGIQGVDVTTDSADLYGMPQGVFVSEIIPESGADESDLQKGDIIVGIEGVTIQNMQGLQEQLEYYAAGETIELEIERVLEGQEYKRHIISITLTKNNE